MNYATYTDEQFRELVPANLVDLAVRYGAIDKSHLNMEATVEVENKLFAEIGKIVALNTECQSIANSYLTVNQELTQKLSTCESKLATAEEDAAKYRAIRSYMKELGEGLSLLNNATRVLGKE